MKSLPKYLFLLAMPLAVSVGVVKAADAAPNGGGPDRARMQEMREQRMKQLDEKLSLTAEQKIKINAIWAKTAKDARAAREEATEEAGKEIRAKRREAMKAAQQEVRAVLTPEQQKIFDTLPVERPGGGPRGSRRDGDKK